MGEIGDSTSTLRTRPSPSRCCGRLAYFVPSYALAIVGYLAVNVIAARLLGSVRLRPPRRPADGLRTHRAAGPPGTSPGGSPRGLARPGRRRPWSRSASRYRAVLLVPLPVASAATAAVVWLISPGEELEVLTAALSGVLVYQSGYQLLSANFLRGLGHIRTASLLSGRSGGALVALTQAAGVGLVAYFAPSWGLAGVLLGIVAGYLGPLIYVQGVLNRSWPAATGPHHTFRQLRTILGGTGASASARVAAT